MTTATTVVSSISTTTTTTMSGRLEFELRSVLRTVRSFVDACRAHDDEHDAALVSLDARLVASGALSPTTEGTSPAGRVRVLRELVLPTTRRLVAVCDRVDALLDLAPPPPDPGAPPPAPIGLLSLADHADVACWAEYAVWFGTRGFEDALPRPPAERARGAPRSLRGRLLPGAARVAAALSRSTEEGDGNELRAVTEVLTALATRPRFRPALLPRHAGDLVGTSLRSRGVASPVVDGVLLARALRSLAVGARRPAAFRDAVAAELDALTRRDLRSVVDVFVREAERVPGVDPRAAAARLARALTTRSRRGDGVPDATVWETLLREETDVWGRTLLAEVTSLAATKDRRHATDVVANADAVRDLADVLPPRHATLYLLLRHGALDVTLTRACDERDAVKRRRTLAVVRRLLETYVNDETSVRQAATYLLKAATVSSSDLSSVRADAVSLSTELDADDNPVADLLRRIEQRCELVVEVVGTMRPDPDDSRKNNDDTKNDENDDDNLPVSTTLASALFRLALTTFYSSASSSGNRNRRRNRFTPFAPKSRLAAAALLPMLCERLPADALLVSGQGVLDTVGRIIKNAAATTTTTGDEVAVRDDPRRDDDNDEWDVDVVADENDDDPNDHDDELDALLCNLSVDDDDDDSSVRGTFNVCLGLLVALLELGEQRRSSEEEALLRSLSPALRALSASDDAETAEMAAHAAALVASRGAVDEETSTTTNIQSSSVSSAIDAAARDLRSEAPPLRARGAARILRAARAITAEREARRARVTEVGRDDGDDETTRLRLLLRAAVAALNDDESYVYLAAVQAVSAVADARPALALPILVRALSRGVLVAGDGDDDEVDHLTTDQRVKLAEALTFALQRRGRAVAHHLEGPLMDELLRDCGRYEDEDEDDERAARVRDETRAHFARAPDDVDDDDRRLRIAVGGPVFAHEARDAVRAGRLSCLAAAVPRLSAPAVGRCAHRLARACADALRLDRARVVRRAAGRTAGALYRRAAEDDDEADAVAVAAELVRHGEDVLAAVLEERVARDDDDATVARCREALEYRRRCREERGLFAAAAAAVVRGEDDAAVADAVRRMLREDARTTTTSTTTRGRVNASTLRLDF